MRHAKPTVPKEPHPFQMHVVVNWFEELKERVPVE